MLHYVNQERFCNTNKYQSPNSHLHMHAHSTNEHTGNIVLLDSSKQDYERAEIQLKYQYQVTV